MLSDETLRVPPPEAPNVGWWRLMIDARHQRRGIGRKVIGLCSSTLAVGPECARSTRRTCPGRRQALFYRGLGFEPNGEVDDGETVSVYPLHRA